MHNGQLPFLKKGFVLMSCHIILFAVVVRVTNVVGVYLLSWKMLCHMFACL
jgi:hypothetical protein